MSSDYKDPQQATALPAAHEPQTAPAFTQNEGSNPTWLGEEATSSRPMTDQEMVDAIMADELGECGPEQGSMGPMASAGHGAAASEPPVGNALIDQIRGVSPVLADVLLRGFEPVYGDSITALIADRVAKATSELGLDKLASEAM